jgi:hypothetical protein
LLSRGGSIPSVNSRKMVMKGNASRIQVMAADLGLARMDFMASFIFVVSTPVKNYSTLSKHTG